MANEVRWIVLAALGLGQLVCAGGADANEPVRLVQWQPYDISLNADREHAWWTFPASADFVHEASESAIRIEAFWDGGRTWVVRFAPPLPGRWTCTTESRDSGLDGHSGTIEVRMPTQQEVVANANYRGHLRISPNGRYFEHADGTPFFLMASTLWAGNTARCGLGSNQDGPFFQYLSDRKRKGFTAILMQLFHGFGDYGYGRYPEVLGHRNEGGKPFHDGVVTELNPEHFRYLDRRMHAVWERGLVAATPTAWFGKTGECHFTLEDAKRISCYLRVRYGAYSSLWALSGEYQYTFRDCDWTAEGINELGRAVQRHNPYEHPLSIHPSGRTNWPAPHNVQSSLPFHEERWLDHHWLQTGQSVDRLYNIVRRAEENRALRPVKPVFCSESYYERASDPHSAYHMRWQGWTAFLSGCAGYGYGAFGIWQFYDPNDPEGETGKATRDVVPWPRAMQFPGPSMLKHVAALLTSIEWWRLEPARDRLRIDGEPCPAPTRTDLTPPHAATIPGELWVVYLPRGNGGRDISLPTDATNTVARIRWYDPRQGTWLRPDGSGLREGGTLPPRPAPSNEDWVFVLEQGN